VASDSPLHNREPGKARSPREAGPAFSAPTESTTLSADSVYRRTEGIISRRVVDELILVPVRRNLAEMDTLYSLNELGARIFQLIDGKRTLRQLAFLVSDEFELSLARALTEVAAFMQRLVEVDAVRRA